MLEDSENHDNRITLIQQQSKVCSTENIHHEASLSASWCRPNEEINFTEAYNYFNKDCSKTLIVLYFLPLLYSYELGGCLSEIFIHTFFLFWT